MSIGKIGGPVSTRLGKRARVAALAALAAAALGLTACSGGEGLLGDASQNSLDGGLTSSIEKAVKSAMKLSGSTGAVVGVWKGDGAYVQGIGDGVSANTRIRGAQATQPVMCALLLDLVESGKLKLDREISKDLPRQVGIDGITYGQLCTETSGLADFKTRTVANIFNNNPTRQWPEGELLAQALAHSPLSAPGEEVHPADTNALVLARALRMATNTPIEDLLQSHVFSKAGMGSSYFPENPATNTTVQGGMTGFTRPFSGKKVVCDVDATPVPAVSPSMLGGAGATVTTVTDLKKFYESYLGGDFGGDSAGVVTETAPVAGKKAAQWGFGVEQVGPLYGMSGTMTGTITAAYHDPKSGFSVVVSLNDSSSGSRFARALALQLAAVAGDAVDWSAEDQAATLEKLAACP